MISKEMGQAINSQVNDELYSAYLYFAMSTWATGEGFAGMGAWLFAQGQEELTHAHRLFHYLQRVGASIVLTAIDAPPATYDSPLVVFEAVLAHERKVTGLIHDLAALARDEKDFATENMLQWFVNEQVEEEESINGVLDKMRLAGNSANALFMIDRELGVRTSA